MNIVGSKALRARARDTDQVSDSGASFKLSTKNTSAILLWVWDFNSEGGSSQKEKDKVLLMLNICPKLWFGFLSTAVFWRLLNLKADDVDKKVYSLFNICWLMLIVVLILLALMREQILELATGSCQLLLQAKYPQEIFYANIPQSFHLCRIL